jgi:hypothetical protein
VADGTAREIDVVGEINEVRQLKLSNNERGHLSLTVRLLIEAKGLERGAAFVALTTGNGMPLDDLVTYRTYWGGAPSFGITEPIGGVAAHRFAAVAKRAFADLCGAKVAYQWTLGRRRRDGEPFADQEENFGKALDCIVRAAHAETARQSKEIKLPPVTHVTISVPVLALATRLLVYNADTETLSPIDRMMLVRGFDVGVGTGIRLVDLVTEGAIPSFLEKYQAAAALLATDLAEAGDLVLATAREQVNRRATQLLENA